MDEEQPHLHLPANQDKRGGNGNTSNQSLRPPKRCYIINRISFIHLSTSLNLKAFLFIAENYNENSQSCVANSLVCQIATENIAPGSLCDDDQHYLLMSPCNSLRLPPSPVQKYTETPKRRLQPQ